MALNVAKLSEDYALSNTLRLCITNEIDFLVTEITNPYLIFIISLLLREHLL